MVRTYTTALPSSRQSHASGYWVMLMTSQPASLNHFDSAFVENRGPPMTTIVPRSWTSIPWARAGAGKEGPPPAGHAGEEERVRRRAVGRVHLDLANVIEERVEARAAEH